VSKDSKLLKVTLESAAPIKLDIKIAPLSKYLKDYL